tara:strand:+ start:170 stop:427 length:258 start_codon:yes stop_codon:yes gene_type:complete
MNFKETANKILEEQNADYKERKTKLVENLQSLAGAAEEDWWDGPDTSTFKSLHREWSELRELRSAATYEDNVGRGYEGSDQGSYR